MKKTATENANHIILGYVIKMIVTGVASILLYSYAFSLLAVRLDWGYDMADVLTLIICALSALSVAFVSLTGLKKHLLAMGIISEIPLMIYSLFNLIFNDNSIVFFAVKLVIMLLSGALCAVIKTKRGKRFKI